MIIIVALMRIVLLMEFKNMNKAKREGKKQ